MTNYIRLYQSVYTKIQWNSFFGKTIIDSCINSKICVDDNLIKKLMDTQYVDELNESRTIFLEKPNIDSLIQITKSLSDTNFSYRRLMIGC